MFFGHLRTLDSRMCIYNLMDKLKMMASKRLAAGRHRNLLQTSLCDEGNRQGKRRCHAQLKISVYNSTVVHFEENAAKVVQGREEG